MLFPVTDGVTGQVLCSVIGRVITVFTFKYTSCTILSMSTFCRLSIIGKIILSLSTDLPDPTLNPNVVVGFWLLFWGCWIFYFLFFFFIFFFCCVLVQIQKTYRSCLKKSVSVLESSIGCCLIGIILNIPSRE